MSADSSAPAAAAAATSTPVRVSGASSSVAALRAKLERGGSFNPAMQLTPGQNKSPLQQRKAPEQASIDESAAESSSAPVDASAAAPLATPQRASKKPTRRPTTAKSFAPLASTAGASASAASAVAPASSSLESDEPVLVDSAPSSAASSSSSPSSPAPDASKDPAASWSFFGAAASLFWTLTGIKLLCMPFYRSTDFDVHRNWLAITHSLPMKQWYLESTSQWTLDYPPFFALFEWLLSFPAKYFDPQMLVITAEPYQSPRTVLYQRLTVIVSDIVLFYAIIQFVRIRSAWTASFSCRARRLALLFLCFANPGLLLLDHVHFQYNGFLLGLFLLSLGSMLRNEPLWGGFWFAVLLQFKHIFLYVAPVYFIALLSGYVIERDASGRARGFRLGRLVKLGAIVVAVFAASLGPFIAWGQLAQLGSRLFPFQRGLCHAYWAPNLWVFYNLADKVLISVARKAGAILPAAAMAGSTSRGLVEDVSHVVLPTVKSVYTFVLTVSAMAPVLFKLARRPHPTVFLAAINYCSMCSFMLGWHVHEKAIMLTILPLGLCACNSVRDARTYLFLSIVGHYSLFPLLFRTTETPLKLLLVGTFTGLSLLVLSEYHRRQQAARRIAYAGLLTTLERVYLAGLLPLYALTDVVLPLLFPAWSFMPLLLTSSYCAIGTMHAWRLCYQATTHAVARVEDSDEVQQAVHEE